LSEGDMLDHKAVDNSIGTGEARGEWIQGFAFVICVCVCAGLCLIFVLDIIAPGQPCEIELESRINPNDAPIASLVRLSGIGVSRAGAIVAYRESYGRKDGDSRAFRDCNDLQEVKGIGPKTAENNRRWLKFE
jgi:competence ComEA-like helix-hairpin-helix protein